MDEDYILLAGCILTDDYGRILLLHRSFDETGHWELPGGKVEEGELPEETAVREIYEELGVAVRLTRALGSDVFKEGDRAYKFHWFQASILEGEVRAVETETFDDFDYIDIEDFASVSLSPAMLVLQGKLLSGDIVLE